MPLTPESRPQPSPNVLSQRVEQETVLVTTDLAHIKVLNETGARVWALADGERTVQEIAAQISAEFEVGPEAALADALAFLNVLAEKRLIVGIPDSRP